GMRSRRNIEDKGDLGKRHLDLLRQLCAAAIEGGFRVDGHGLEFDSMFTCALVADDVGAGDQCCDHCLGRRRALIRAIALFGLVDDRSDIAYGNFRARMGRTIAMNTLGDGGLLFHDNHVASRSLLQDSWRSTCRPPVIKAFARSYRPRDALSVIVFSVGSFHEPIAWLQG